MTPIEKAAIEYADAVAAYDAAPIDDDREEWDVVKVASARLTAAVDAERPLLAARARGEQAIRELHRDAVRALSSGALRDFLAVKDPTCALRFLLRSTPLERAAARYVLARIHCAADADAMANKFFEACDEPGCSAETATPLEHAALSYAHGVAVSWVDLCDAVSARLDAVD